MFKRKAMKQQRPLSLTYYSKLAW